MSVLKNYLGLTVLFLLVFAACKNKKNYDTPVQKAVYQYLQQNLTEPSLYQIGRAHV